MKRTGRKHEFALSAAVVAAFATFWFVEFALGDAPEFRSQYVSSAILVAIVATPWVIAVRLLWRAWWARMAVHLSAMDGPARLLAAAVVTLPENRHEWGEAMMAELTHVQSHSARWWFSAGCARAAMFPPLNGSMPTVVVGALAVAAVVTAGPAVSYALPAMQIFAVTFVALVGTLATFAVARSRLARRALPGPTIATAGVAGVAGCIALTAYFLIKHPTAGEQLAPTTAVVFAAALAGCLWLALIPPRGLTTSRPARGLGVGAALILGLGFLLTSRLTVNTYGGPMVWVIFAPVVIFFAASAMAAAVGGSFRAGVQAAVWTALVGALLVFAISLPEAMRRYAIDGRTLGDGEFGYPIGVNLPGAIWDFIVIPILGLPFGVIGAAVACRWRWAPHFKPLRAENL